MTFQNIDDRRIAEDDWIEFESRLTPAERDWIYAGDKLEMKREGLQKELGLTKTALATRVKLLESNACPTRSFLRFMINTCVRKGRRVSEIENELYELEEPF